MEFVALYEPIAYRLLRRHGLQDADAREVMQDLFTGGEPQYRPLGSGEGARIVSEAGCGESRNLVINWLKQRASGTRLRSEARTCRRCWTSCPSTLRPENGRVRSGVASCAVSTGGRTGTGGSSASDMASLLGDRRRRNFARRMPPKTRNDGRRDPGRQMSRPGSAASCREGNGERDMKSPAPSHFWNRRWPETCQQMPRTLCTNTWKSVTECAAGLGTHGRRASLVPGSRLAAGQR